ncbi:uncharacterized protein LOC109848157 isoform X2 [Asparagus officinalis]|uniref:uncharacterized protein LOC109848157 isoform X2 n=1 Tax=Asparagus officinalis TaxID=4686 RepID=UPI00098DF0E0|nr:uncharacterized protein LOC109848157 isoform X2 [Asparagus officinalis]
MASIDGESLEVEAKHKDNGSWQPCRVSLRSSDSKFVINIDFDNSNEEDVISTKEDALTRLRFRSSPLKDGECSHINEGDHVLAMYKDQFKSMFFDAVIEKPFRVKHSNRVFCRCTFEIKWLNPEHEDETLTVPSKLIKKLSKEKIDTHPFFAAFLNASNPTDEVVVPSSPSLLEETSFEADLEDLLEKQIEEISKLAAGSMECPLDLLDVKRGSNNSKNNLRRTTRSQNKQQTEVDLKKEPEGDKPFLSPLAARAALASFVHEHESPLKRELPFSHVEKESQECLFQKNPKEHIEVHSLDVTYEYMKSGVSSQESSYLGKPLQSTEESREKGCDSMNLKKPRVTRSSMHKGLEILSDEVKGKSSREKLTSPLNTRKTRSSLNKEIEASLEETKLISPVNATRLTRSRKSSNVEPQPEKSDLIQNAREMSEEVEDKKASSPATVNDSIDSTRIQRLSFQSTTTRVTRSVHKEIKASSDEREQGSCSKKPQDITPDGSESMTKRARTRASYAENSGVTLEDRENASGEKKKAERKKAELSKKPQLRSSPRFNSPPRTRS